MALCHVPSPCFGDLLTADVTLRLLSSSSADEDLCLHLHSQVIRRCEFFNPRLSDRWSVGDKLPIEFTLSKCKNPLAYKRCIELMYGSDKVKQTSFTSVEEAIEILEVAGELLFLECVKACMGFLEAAPWSADNENAIRAYVTSSSLETTPDLAARLFISPCCGPTKILMHLWSELLTLTGNQDCTDEAREIIATILRNNNKPIVSAASSRITEAALYGEWCRHFFNLQHYYGQYAAAATQPVQLNLSELHVTTSALLWLLEQLLALKMADLAVKMFVEGEDAPKMAGILNEFNSRREIVLCYLSVLQRILQAFQSGDVTISISTRLALVKSWLLVPRLFSYLSKQDSLNLLQQDLIKGLCTLIETLPHVDQSECFQIWFDKFLKKGLATPDLSAPLQLFVEKLSQVHEEE